GASLQFHLIPDVRWALAQGLLACCHVLVALTGAAREHATRSPLLMLLWIERGRLVKPPATRPHFPSPGLEAMSLRASFELSAVSSMQRERRPPTHRLCGAAPPITRPWWPKRLEKQTTWCSAS